MRPIERAQTILQRLISKQIRFQSARAARAVADFSETLKDVSSDVAKRRNNITIERISSSITDSLDAASQYLSNTQGDRLFEDVEAFARKQPVLATGAAALSAFAAARLLKVSLMANE